MRRRCAADGDHSRIVRRLFFEEFPWDLRMAGRLTIWHLYAVPGTAAVIGSTGALATRAELTSLMFGDLLEGGLDTPRAREIFRVINHGHQAGGVSREDNRYAIAALAVNAVRWLDRYGARRPTAVERHALTNFFADVGHRIGVPDVPRRYGELAAYFAGCERERIAYSPAGRAASERTLDMVRARTPAPLRPWIPVLFAAMLPVPVARAVGLPDPPSAVRRAVTAVLTLRGRVVGGLPPRREPTTPRSRRGLPSFADDPTAAARSIGGLNP